MDPNQSRLSAFIPKTLWELLGTGKTRKTAAGAVLFADLAGFTRLTDSLATIGKEGAEELTRILNGFFSSMITVVDDAGGDIVRFGGDAMTIFIPSSQELALRTALMLQAESKKFECVRTRAGDFPLKMKIGVAFGEVNFVVVGDGDVGFEYFASGRALDMAAEAEHRGKVEQIVVHEPGMDPSLASSLGFSGVEEGYLLLDPVDARNARLSGPAEGPAPGFGPTPSEDVISGFLHSFIREKALALDERDVGEHRRTTVLFLSLGAIDYENDPGAVDRVRGAYKEIAYLTKKYGGVINKVDMGDKGSKVLCLFGSPRALEHQEEMAVRCALEIMNNPVLSIAVPGTRIGVTVSSVFSAYVGCDIRREYTVMGNGINLSARLMAASPPHGMLVSEEVHEKTREAVDYEILEPISVKGKAEKVPVFVPRKVRAVSHAAKSFVGRTKELTDILVAVGDPEMPSLVAVTGPAGVGKSVLVAQAKEKCDLLSVETIFTRLASYDREKFFAAWKGIVSHCLELDHAGDQELTAEAVSAQINEEDREYMPLFNDIFKLNIPENASTRALSSKDRKDIFFAIVSRLIIKKTAGGPHCILIDHLDYADPSSVEFLGELSTDAKGTPLKIVVTLRDSSPDLLKSVIATACQVPLPPFSEPEINDFVIQIGGFAPPAETFLDFLLKKTGGNPKFLEEMISIMKRQGLAFVGPSGNFEVDEDKLSSAIFPDTLQSLFLTRVENLQETEQQLLKSASVLGTSFSIETLSAITEKTPDQLTAKIRELEGADLVRMDTWGARSYASFSDNLLRDALYDSLNFQIRRELHMKVALFLEKQGGGEPRVGPVLARHFENAGDEEKALHYLWSSAEYSRSLYDNRSAYDYLGRFVAISEKRGAAPSSDRTFLDALMYFADVQQELGRIAEADDLYKRILDDVLETGQDRVKAMSRLADNKRRVGNLKESLELYDKALEGAKQLKDEALQCRIFLDSGVPLAMMGKMGKAMDHFQRAENIAAKISDHPSLVYALMNRGLVEYFKGKLEGAKSLLLKAREVAKEHDLKSYLALITTNLASVHFEMGEYERALEICDETVEISRQFGYRNHLVMALSNKALFETMLGEFDRAATSVEKALISARHYGMNYSIAASLHTKSLLNFVEGRFSGSIRCQTEALDTYMSESHNGEALGCLSEIIATTNYLCSPGLAEPAVSGHLDKLQNELQNVTRTWTISYMAHSAFRRFLEGDLDSYDAADALENVLERARESGILWLVADVGNVLLKVHQSAENHGKASECGMELFPLLSTHHCPLILPRFLISLAVSLLENGQEEDLAQVMGCLQRYGRFLDRGPYGMEYSLLLHRVALAAGNGSAEAEMKKASAMAVSILSREKDGDVKEALLNLPAFKAAQAGQ